MEKNSFTLLETLVSVIILAVLTSAIAGIFSYQHKGIENINNIQNGYNSFYLNSQILNNDKKELTLTTTYKNNTQNQQVKNFQTKVYEQNGVYLYRIVNE